MSKVFLSKKFLLISLKKTLIKLDLFEDFNFMLRFELLRLDCIKPKI